MPGVRAAGAVYLRPLELGPIGQETSALLKGQTEDAADADPTLNLSGHTRLFPRDASPAD